jgi:hypothetical protein
MAGVSLFRIDKVIECVHYPEARAVVAHWESLSTAECVAAIQRGSEECRRVGAKTWIVDLTQNPGVPSQSDLRWMETEGVALAKRNGLTAVINVHGESAVAAMGSKRWTRGASAGGMTTYDCKSLDDALELAAQIASGRAA